MMWQQPKDVNYYNRLSLLNKVKRVIENTMRVGDILIFPEPVAYSYQGGVVKLLHVERYEYMSAFKRPFKIIRFLLDNGQYVKLQQLRMKHLVEIYKYLPKQPAV